MKLYKCDKCRNVVEKVIIINFQCTKNIFNPFQYNCREICINCFIEFESWINNRIYILPKRIFNDNDKTIKEVKL